MKQVKERKIDTKEGYENLALLCDMPAISQTFHIEVWL